MTVLASRRLRGLPWRRGALIGIVIPFVLAATLWGCVSPEKLLDQGIQLEKEGRYHEAADRYIRALRKDGSLEEARVRLAEAGRLAIESDLERSNTFHELGRALEAADALRPIGGLVVAAGEVGVHLDLPSGYASMLRERFDLAIDLLMTRADASAAVGQWPAAVRDLERVGNYEPSPDQQRAATDRLAATYVSWTEDDLAKGRFKSALAHVDRAIDVLGGPGSEEAEFAVGLRERVIEEGTLWVAATPVLPSPKLEGAIPRYFLPELNDDLMVNRWTAPPLLVGMVDPIEVRLFMRDLGYQGLPLDPRRGSVIAREIGADLALIAEITRFDAVERNVVKERVLVGTRSGTDAEFLRIKAEHHVEANLRWALVHGYNGALLEEGRLRAHRSGAIERVEYDGDPDELLLSRTDAGLFEGRRYLETVEAIEADLIPELAARLAHRVYESVLASIE